MTARFDDLVDQWEAKLKQAFLRSIYNVRDAAQIARIAEALERGNVDEALRAVGLDPAAFRPLDLALLQSFEDGGNVTMRGIPALRQPDGFRLDVLFDVRNMRAENWLSEHSGALIREVIADQRAAIRQHLTAGMREGLNPHTVALDLVGRIDAVTKRRTGGVLGLTSSQEAWTRAYEAELSDLKTMTQALERNLRDKRFDRAVLNAIRDGKPLTSVQIGTMTRSYRNRALRFRAEMLARSEAMTALHVAQEEAVQQALDAGQIDRSATTFKWRSARDRRVRDAHRHLDGKSVRAGESFQSDLGPIRFPGDPRAAAANRIGCRCWREVAVDFMAGVR